MLLDLCLEMWVSCMLDNSRSTDIYSILNSNRCYCNIMNAKS